MLASTFNLQKELFDLFEKKVLSLPTIESEVECLFCAVAASSLQKHMKLRLLARFLDKVKADLASKWNLLQPGKILQFTK